jgi:hypothetical protein
MRWRDRRSETQDCYRPILTLRGQGSLIEPQSREVESSEIALQAAGMDAECRGKNSFARKKKGGVDLLLLLSAKSE